MKQQNKPVYDAEYLLSIMDEKFKQFEKSESFVTFARVIHDLGKE